LFERDFVQERLVWILGARGVRRELARPYYEPVHRE
jgi:hypothetical protein